MADTFTYEHELHLDPTCEHEPVFYRVLGVIACSKCHGVLKRGENMKIHVGDGEDMTISYDMSFKLETGGFSVSVYG